MEGKLPLVSVVTAVKSSPSFQKKTARSVIKGSKYDKVVAIFFIKEVYLNWLNCSRL